ncbi:MAG: hypothetical protein WHV66_05935 [Anaerolineales bacterium]
MQHHIKALRVFCARLSNTNICWTITGSARFALQGVPVEVHDIDLQTNVPVAYRVQDVLSVAWFN